MLDYRLRIIPLDDLGNKYLSRPIVLDLYPDKLNREQSSPSEFVINSAKYKIQILCKKQLAQHYWRWDVLLNGEEQRIDEAIWNSREKIMEISLDGEQSFRDLLGYAIFQLKITSEDSTKIFKCLPIKIFYKDKWLGTLVTRIARYVSEKGGNFLLKQRGYDIAEKNKNTGISLHCSEIIPFVKRIVRAYEQDIGYFRSNSRAKIKIEGRIDSLEKLRSFTGDTLRFIATHPEELFPSSKFTGIRAGLMPYIPRRSWIQGDRVDRNIYENRIILGFLKTVAISLSDRLLESLGEDEPNQVQFTEDNVEYQGLQDTSFLIKTALQQEQKELSELVSKLNELFIRYKDFMQAEPMYINGYPKPTAIFMSIPAYNRIYKLIDEWPKYEKVELVKTTFFLEPDSTSRIYEYYCLVRLIQELTQRGFQFVGQDEIKWTDDKDSLKENVNNRYYFKRDEEKITLYYQPTIGEKESLIRKSELFLYRNSSGKLSISTDKNHVELQEKVAQGGSHFYTPDYVLKYEHGNTVKHLIADAKFRSSKVIVNEELVTLLFKYQVSISAARERDSIEGVSIFCGKDSKRPAKDPLLFNIKNPITRKFGKEVFRVCQIHPGSRDNMIPDDFFLNRVS